MKHALNIAVVMAALGFFLWMDSQAKEARAIPDRTTPTAPVVHVDSQKDIYALYKKSGLWGVRVVHLNRFLNMVDYLPREENVSMPFPVRVKDVRPLYEKGLNAHNWLFIANRTGLVRSVTIVLPESVLKARKAEFADNFAFDLSGDVIKGYTFDMPIMVTTLDAMPAIQEPVILNVDAGFFVRGVEPGRVIAKLKEKCPDIRQMVVSESSDEPDVDDSDRDRLQAFEKEWTNSR